MRTLLISSTRIVFFLGLSYIMTVTLAVASPHVIKSLAGLTAQADLIVSGTTEVTITNGLLSGTVTVDNVLKGAAIVGSVVPISWPEYRGSGVVAAKILRGHGIIFLQNNGGTFRVLPTIGGDSQWDQVYIPTVATQQKGLITAVAAAQAKGSLDAVAVAIIDKVESGQASSYDLVYLYRETKSPVIAAAFNGFRNSSDKELVCLGLAGNLSMGDASALVELHKRNASLASARRWPMVLNQVRSILDPTNIEAIRTLELVVGDKTVVTELRAAAATVLARIHSRQTLPYLAALLSESDVSLQAAAVGGLASFGNNVPVGGHEPAPGPWPFRDQGTISHSVFDEKVLRDNGLYYTSFWLAWWQNHKAELTQ